MPHADFVIEGYVDPTEPLRDEGPFGDHTGYYTLNVRSCRPPSSGFGATNPASRRPSPRRRDA